MQDFWVVANGSGIFNVGPWSLGHVPTNNDYAILPDGSYTVSVTANGLAPLGISIGTGVTFSISNETFTAREGTGTGANQGTIFLSGTALLAIGGPFNNMQTIELDGSGGFGPTLSFGSDSVLKGGGSIVMSGPSFDVTIQSAVINGPVTNVDNTISGRGIIDNTLGPFDNQKKGIVNANDGVGISVEHGSVLNAGIFEATQGADLAFFGVDITNTSTGIIQADSFSGLALNVGTTVHAGTVKSDGFFSTNGLVTLDGSNEFVPTSTMITLGGRLRLGGQLMLKGTINNIGSIDTNGANSIEMESAGARHGVTLQGSGSIMMGDGSFVFGDSLATPLTLTNINNHITGAGTIGAGNLALNNHGLIDATSSAVPLIIDTGLNTVINSGTLQADPNATLAVGSMLTNSGSLIANGGYLSFEGAVTGGRGTINDAGFIEFGAGSNTKVTFGAGSTGRLVLDDPAHYTGTIVGFGANHNTTHAIDLPSFVFSSNLLDSYSPNTDGTAGGVLSLNDLAGHTAHLHFSGTYKLASFKLEAAASGGQRPGMLITDPVVVNQKPGNAPATIASDTVLDINVRDSGQVTFAGSTGTLWLDHPSYFTGNVAGFGAEDSIDLLGVGFNAHTTLGYSENSSGTGGTLSVTDATHTAKVALLGNYMASSFAAASDGHGGTLIAEAPAVINPQSPVTLPHA